MKWEYGMLFHLHNTSPGVSGYNKTRFTGPDGDHDLGDIRHIEALNHLGLEGWEAYSAQVRHAGNAYFEYYYWLKRLVEG